MADFTNKQKAFIAAYLGPAKFNAVEACRQAGYSHPEASSQDLMRPDYKVRKEIERRLEERFPSESELLDELRTIAMAEHGDDWIKASDKRQAIRDIHELLGKIIRKHEHTVEPADQVKSILGLTDEDKGG